MNKYKKYIPIIFVVLPVIMLVIYFSFRNSNPVANHLSGIQRIAQDYRSKNGNFGIILPNEKLNNCFSGNTFIKLPEMNEILLGKDVENISCVFKTASGTPVVEAWSITIVKGERAFCEDSSGARMETPGLTSKEVCMLDD